MPKGPSSSPSPEQPPPIVRHLAEQRADEERDAPHRLLIEYLKEVREPCPSCRYELHNLQSARCPECGERLVMRVGLESPKLAAFIAGLVGIAGGLGFSGLLFLFVAYMVFIGRGPGPARSDFVLLAVESGVTLAILLVWIRASGWIRRLPVYLSWTLAAVCFAVPVANLLVFVSLVGG